MQQILETRSRAGIISGMRNRANIAGRRSSLLAMTESKSVYKLQRRCEGCGVMDRTKGISVSRG